MKSLGIEVISISEPVDDSPAGQLLEGIIEVIDEFYSTNLAQDTMRGMAESARRGFFTSGTVPPEYKREKIKDGSVERTKLVPNPVYAPVVQKIFNLAVNGQSLKAIAQIINKEKTTTRSGKKWGISKVRQILGNEVYTGSLVWNKRDETGGHVKNKGNQDIIRVENAHPVLVSKQMFDKYRRFLQANESRENHRVPTAAHTCSARKLGRENCAVG